MATVHLAAMTEAQGFGSEIVFGVLNPGGLLRSLEFENLVQDRWMRIRFTLSKAATMDARIAAIRHLLRV